MDWVYQYRDPERLYLNVTNRGDFRLQIGRQLR